MKRTWPLLFLTFLFVAIVVRTVPTAKAPHDSLPPTFPVETAEALPLPAVAASPRPEPQAAAETLEAPPKKSAVSSAISWFVLHQNEDGSWGDGPASLGGRTLGRSGITALVLLTFLGSGYSHLSKDDLEGRVAKDVILKALQWLERDQREDGTQQSNADAGLDQAIVALAWSEAYGMTGSQRLKEHATRTLEAMLRMQGADGSWGGDEPTAWAGWALMSAEINDLPVPAEVRERAERYIRTMPHPAQVMNRMFLTKNKRSVDVEAFVLASSPPSGEGRDFSDWFHASMGVFQYDGPDGPCWKEWKEPLTNAILPRQHRDGSWPGGSLSHTIVRSSLAAQTLQVYYRYANVFAANR
jgi:hypothetical protein